MQNAEDDDDDDDAEDEGVVKQVTRHGKKSGRGAGAVSLLSPMNDTPIYLPTLIPVWY